MLEKTHNEINSFISEREIKLIYKDKIEEILFDKDRYKEKKILQLEDILKQNELKPKLSKSELNKIKKRLNNYKKYGLEIQVVDGMYINENGKLEIIECYTEYYTERDFEAKRNFTELVLEKEVESIRWIKGYK